MSEVFSPKVGDFASVLYVSDTAVYEVVKVTDKTITVRSTKDVYDSEGIPVSMKDPHTNPGAYGLNVVWYAVAPLPFAQTQVLRRRKDGTFRMFRGGRPLYPANTVEIDGVRYPVRRRDWRD